MDPISPVQGFQEWNLSFLSLGLLVTAISVGAMGAFFFLVGRYIAGSGGESPYTGGRLRPASELTFERIEAINSFLQKELGESYEPFDPARASVCEDTGRIFPNNLNRFGIPRGGWSFLPQRRRLVSWGSLTEQQQGEMGDLFGDLQGYQVSTSSKRRKPKDGEAWLVRVKPGPLYVDLKRKRLLGWKLVPGTELEFLIPATPRN